MSGARVVVDDVVFHYPGATSPVLDHLNVAIEVGERVAVLGPNGSGKTTFALHLNGLLALQHGRIDIDHTMLGPATLAEVRRRVGAVFQDPDDQLFMNTVREDVGFGPANLGIRPAAREAVIAEALEAVGAGGLADRTPHHLSGGEKRRVAIATVLAMRPDVLVLDEPTSGLDPVGRRELAELLATLDQTQVIVTHDLPFAFATCPRALVLDGGRFVVDRPTRELLHDPETLRRHRLELPFGFSPPG